MGNRFWEFYLVRYLLGTIFGVIILIYLVSNYSSEISQAFYKVKSSDSSSSSETKIHDIGSEIYKLLFDTTYSLKKDDVNVLLKLSGNNAIFDISDQDKNDLVFKQSGLTVLAAIILVVSGFLYMYFSSMLILVFHGIRFSLYNFFETIKQTKLKLKIIESSFVVGVIIIIIIAGMIYENLHLISIVVIVLWTIIMATQFDQIKKFYFDLSEFRAQNVKNNKIKLKLVKTQRNSLEISTKQDNENEATNEVGEYIESYRHLREHGNAFGIIICEILFAIWLIVWEFSFFSIFYWCILGFTSWVLGTYLEISAVKNRTE